MALLLEPIEPAEQFPEYDYTVQLGKATFRIVLRWQERQASWYLSLFDSNDVALVRGRRMSVDYSLLWRYVKDGMPDGQIVLIDTSFAGEECGFEDLGHRCKLFWFDRASLPEPATPNITIT